MPNPRQMNQPASPDLVVPLLVAPSGAGVDVLVLTEDDYFLLSVRKVVKLPHRIWHATSETQAADMLISSPCAVALIDYSMLRSRLVTMITRLREQFPDLAFVIAGEADDEAAVGELIAGGEVQGFVLKEQTTHRLAVALDEGVNHHLGVRAAEEERRLAAKRRKLYGWAAAGILVCATIGVAVWYARESKPAPPPETAADIINYAQTAGKAEWLAAVEEPLHLARKAFEARQYEAAVAHFQDVTLIDPSNAEAADGLSRIAEIMLARTELALAQGNTRAASRHLNTAGLAQPDNPHIAALEAQIAREDAAIKAAQERETERLAELERRRAEQRAAAAAAAAASTTPEPSRAEQEAAARETAEAERLLALGQERLGQGRLLAPASDNAQYYLLQARQLRPEHPDLQPALAALQARLMDEAESAMTRNDTAGAREFLDAARGSGASGGRYEQIAADIGRANLQARLLSTPSALHQDMIERHIQPNYPLRARQNGVEGMVDLRIWVDKEGNVKDAKVTSASPTGYFEEEAVRAVKRWKIKPKVIEGETYEQLLALRLRFALD